MTALQLFGKVKDIYTSHPQAEEWFDMRSLMSELWLKYGCDTMTHILFPDKEIPFAHDLIADALRAAEGYPLQYIVGKAPFWQGEFYVGEGVLIPRSDTERTVELALERINDGDVVYDLCCGSGCIGISMLQSRNDIKRCYSFDISDIALQYTKRNAVLNGVSDRLEAVKHDVMSEGFPKDIPMADVIVSNPPYIRNDEMPLLPQNVRFEPDIALAGGEDGCDFYRKILKDSEKMLKKGGWLLFEIAPAQADILLPLFEELKFEASVYRDYHGNIRTICGKR